MAEFFWVKSGSGLSPVLVNHWWPGREFAGTPPIPCIFIKEAERRGSKYLTTATVILPEFDFVEIAYCNPVDVPSKKRGRHIAVNRLRKRLKEAGYEVVEDGNE